MLRVLCEECTTTLVASSAAGGDCDYELALVSALRVSDGCVFVVTVLKIIFAR